MAWKDEIRYALQHLGGEAPLQEIYDYIERHGHMPLSVNWMATVRGTLEKYSSDSRAFINKEDLLYSVNGPGYGD